MELDDCQWVHCFLLSEATSHALDDRRDEEEDPGGTQTVLQELGPLKDIIEEESDVIIQELAPLKIKEEENVVVEACGGEEEEEEVEEDLKPNPDTSVAATAAGAPAVSLDRLKSLLASQLKACLSRVPSTPPPPVPCEAKQEECDGVKLKCDHCSQFFSKEDLAAHLLREICHSSYPCTLCSRIFSRKAEFTLHMCIKEERMRDSPAATQNNTRHQCTICTKTFVNSDSLISHAKGHSQERVAVHCPICNDEFPSNKKLINHLVTHKAKDGQDSTGKPVKLNSETKGGKDPIVKPVKLNSKTVKLHCRREGIEVNMVNPIKLRKSPLVSSKQRKSHRNLTVLPSKLQSEVRTKSNTKSQLQPSHEEVECDDKSILFATKLKTELKKKLEAKISFQPSKRQSRKDSSKLHREEKSPRITMCRNRQSRRSRARLRQTHRCDKCAMCFESLQSLTIHMKKHSIDTLFTCTVCFKKFVRESNLFSHMKLHKQVCKSRTSKPDTNSHQYQCELCKKTSFFSRRQLQAHVRTSHVQQNKPSTRSSQRTRVK